MTSMELHVTTGGPMVGPQISLALASNVKALLDLFPATNSHLLYVSTEIPHSMIHKMQKQLNLP